MTNPLNPRTMHSRGLRHLRASTLSLLMLAAATVAPAAPGAHGPNGEHLDAPAAAGAAGSSALPRVEAHSDDFELVATLHAAALSVLVDRYASNEPVLNAVLEVESGGIKSRATFDADQGDYAFDDAKLLALLRTPGEHALVFTLVAGQDNDLLDATLVTPATGARSVQGDHAHADDEHGHDHGLERAAWAGAGIVALGLAGGTAWWRQRRRNAATVQGGL